MRSFGIRSSCSPAVVVDVADLLAATGRPLAGYLAAFAEVARTELHL